MAVVGFYSRTRKYGVRCVVRERKCWKYKKGVVCSRLVGWLYRNSICMAKGVGSVVNEEVVRLSEKNQPWL